MIQVISEKTLFSEGFASNLRDILYVNSRNYNSNRFSYKLAFILFFAFCYNPKNKDQVFSKLVVSGNEEYFCFLFIASRALRQSHAEFNRLL